jgi:hypothetical protein
MTRAARAPTRAEQVHQLVHVRYQGAMTLTWKGHSSGLRYPFGAMRRVGYVDARDWRHLAALRDADGTPYFEECHVHSL